MKSFEDFLNEGIGEAFAKNLVEKARNAMKNMSDKDVEEFRRWIAMSFDLKMNESAESLKEGAQIRLGRHTYDMIDMQGENGMIKVKVGLDGILGHRETFISWDNVKKLQKKYDR